MQLFSTIFSLALLSLAIASKENWEVVKGLHKGNADLKPGHSVWFYELWAPRGDASDCVSGYRHVRLIQGHRLGKKDKPEEPEDDFVGKAYDLVVRGEESGHSLNGLPTMTNDVVWDAREGNEYQWIDREAKSQDKIASEAKKYIKAHRTYHTGGKDATNCKTFVEDITRVAVTHKAKRELESVFEDAETSATNTMRDLPVRAEVFVA